MAELEVQILARAPVSAKWTCVNLAFVGWLAACGNATICGDGTIEEAGECVLASNSAGAEGAAEPSSSSTASDPSGASAESSNCNGASRRGPSMVQREMPNGRAYCIDTTEVAEGQYLAFLQEAPPVDEQATECLGNRSFDQLEPRVLDPETENYAVKVNWCDALAFCQWAGKRLCEVDVPNVTQEEAEIPQSQLSALFYGVDAVQNDEWLNACTAGGTQLYAWGNVWEDGACGGNVSSPGCADTSGELFGLSGNAAEWIAPCTDWYGCPFRSALLPGPDLPLDYGRCEYAQRSYPAAGLETGFRCCGEPLVGE